MTGILNALIAGVSGAVKDAYFNLVSLLLPGNGTNGAQNNTFLDSSGNTFTITRNGNTTQGTFSPFSQTGWGGYFNGSSSLTPSSGSFLALGTSNYTIEFWIYLTQNVGNNHALAINDTNGLVVVVGATKTSLNQYGVNDVLATGSGLSVNTWNHVAIVRAGTGTNQTSIYINGSRSVQGTDATNWTATANPRIGGNTSIQYIFGYMSNVRVVTSAIYSGASITVPTTPLTAISGTTFLTLQNNRFLDNGSTAATFTTTGSPSVVAFSPFAPTQFYSAAAVGGSGYFDGTGDYLSIADNAAFTMGTGDFTVEAWVYCTAADFASSRYIVAQRNASADTSISFAMNFIGGGFRKVRLLCFDSGGSSYEAVCATDVLNLNEWTHIAGVRNGTTLRIYVNGVQQGTANISTASLVDSDGSVAIGRLGDANTLYWLGYISGLRITKGGCLYPSGTTFTPPTAPPTTTVSSGTVSLLTNFTNAGVVDATAKNVLETVGNAQISTTQSKWGGGSVYFDGNGDNLAGPASVDLDMGTGNWTIEGWVNITTRTLNYPSIISNNNGSFSAGALSLQVSNADSVSYNDRFVLGVYDLGGTRNLVSSVANSTGVWYYFAVVRNGTNLSIYRDGTSVASTTISSGLTFNWGKLGLRVGGGNWDGAQSYLNGYLDDLRITKGVARTITASPTAPFPVQ